MKTENAQDTLRACFIIYADILGYKDRILGCRNDYDALTRELVDFKSKILGPQLSLVEEIAGVGGSVSFFSDSVYVHVPIMSKNPRKIEDGRPYICIPTEKIAEYQFDLALQNIFIRGGATVNYGYMDDSIAFGPGMIDAWDCEKIANSPRICLTKWAIIPIKQYIKLKWPGYERINKFILLDEDGKYFVNYLQTIVDSMEDPYKNKTVEEAVESLKQHKEVISQNLLGAKKNYEVKEKFLWLANYHNYFCRKHFGDQKDLIILDQHRIKFRHFQKEKK
jgi:hypothetical protein